MVCAIVTDEFLQFTQSKGNNLTTPRPEYQFPGLKAGDCWCLCALRWKEAYEAGVILPVKAEAAHEKALELISKQPLKQSCQMMKMHVDIHHRYVGMFKINH
jgi:uncharacterized protein